MPLTVLNTKLFAPPPRSRAVKRSRLLERLEAGVKHPLTLVSAPAGFGKTTLVSDWAANRSDPLAWVSLDETDGDLAHFLTYVVTALQSLSDTIGQGVLTALQAQQPPPMDQLMAALVNDLVRHGNPLTLVLDDYHRLNSTRVDAALAFLLEQAQGLLRLVLITREDPALPLGRMRASGQLSELRPVELRFTVEEAADFLNRTMGLTLTGTDIAELEKRTEGWVAGLQLAAISIQDAADPAQLIRAFSGSHQYVLDYLMEEVLHRQTPDVQSFLLRSSVFEWFCSELCDACLGSTGEGARAMLDNLEQANLFLIPLDTERRWYRYHHLFADLLRQRLRQSESPAAIAGLHRRACYWFMQQGSPMEAFQQAVAADDIDLATVCIVGGNTLPLHMRGEVWPVLDWLSSLPVEALDKRPVLWVIYASALMMVGQLTKIPPKLEAAELALADAKPNGLIRNLHGHIAAIRAFLAVSHHDVDAMRIQSTRALENLDVNNLPPRLGAQLTLGHAHTLSGNRVEAMRIHVEALSASRDIGYRMTINLAMIGIGNLHRMNNQLEASRATFESLLAEAGDPPWPIFGEAHLGLAWIHYQWNDLPKAEAHLRQAQALVEQYENQDRTVACDWLGACLAMAQHDSRSALARLVRTRQGARNRGFMYHVPDLIAEECRVRVLVHEYDVAEDLAEQSDSQRDRARVALARGDASRALALLEAPYELARENDWLDQQLVIRTLQALAYNAEREINQAFACLKDALQLAEPHGFIRLFLDEGPAFASLLSEYQSRGHGTHYVDRLLAAFKEDALVAENTEHRLPDPLNQRELAVLRLIADGLTNQAISERLFLALSTVKGYNQRIFDKLGVKSRTKAVSRARELGLLS